MIAKTPFPLPTHVLVTLSVGLLVALISPLEAVDSICSGGNLTQGFPVVAPIARDQLITAAAETYQGDGLSVTSTATGARLRCDFQRLEGEVTSEGLWLTSKLTDTTRERFHIKAGAIGRTSFQRVPVTGTISIHGSTARLTCAPVVEEYSVSVDGVRQDFVVAERPPGAGDLVLQLDVSGAQVEATPSGANLVFVNSERKIAYSRLKVADALGRELTARLEVIKPGTSPADGAAAPSLAVMVNDADAVYPVRIDPTFSDANWLPMSGSHGANGNVFEAVVDGSGNLYISGSFSQIGDVPISGVAKWDGNRWSALGAGITAGRPYAMLVSGTNLYLGGNFKIVGGEDRYVAMAKWDGTSLSAIDSSWNYGSVSSLALSGSNLYAGGSFSLGTNSEVGIAKWDGSSWSIPGTGIYGQVSDLAVLGSDIIALATPYGSFQQTVVKWDGSSWSTILPGVQGMFVLAASDSDLYVGGNFTQVAGTPANGIAKWDGTNWSALGSGMNHPVRALTVVESNVYAGGEFTTAGGTPAKFIAKWNGSSWGPLGSGVTHFVQTLAVSGGTVYAGGNFITAGGIEAGHIAQWNGTNWNTPGGSGVGVYDVRALASSGGDLYAGGFSITAGQGIQVAKWNGTNWSGLVGEFRDDAFGLTYVRSLAVSGSTVYAGGNFTTVGGMSANNVARWNGSSWSALGSGVDGFVYALAAAGSTLYAGGTFSQAGGVSVYTIARWNGSSWSAMGLGMANGLNQATVQALAVSGSTVYAGGIFVTAGGTAATNIAKWNGSSWSALGSGVNGAVYALAVSGNDLYVAGNFTTAGGVPALGIAKWDGSSWSALGDGVGDGNPGTSDFPEALTVSGSNVYAGGFFETAGGVAVKSIAKWDGSSWSALGSGVSGGFNGSGRVSALTATSTHLYAGGNLQWAGDKIAAGVGRAVLGDALGYNRITSKLSPEGSMQLSYIGYPATKYVLERAFNLTAPDWIPQATNTVGVSGVTLFTNTPASGTNNFWRIHSVP